jgi:hypothetical protein
LIPPWIHYDSAYFHERKFVSPKKAAPRIGQDLRHELLNAHCSGKSGENTVSEMCRKKLTVNKVSKSYVLQTTQL